MEQFRNLKEPLILFSILILTAGVLASGSPRSGFGGDTDDAGMEEVEEVDDEGTEYESTDDGFGSDTDDSGTTTQTNDTLREGFGDDTDDDYTTSQDTTEETTDDAGTSRDGFGDDTDDTWKLDNETDNETDDSTREGFGDDTDDEETSREEFGDDTDDEGTSREEFGDDTDDEGHSGSDDGDDGSNDESGDDTGDDNENEENEEDEESEDGDEISEDEEDEEDTEASEELNPQLTSGIWPGNVKPGDTVHVTGSVQDMEDETLVVRVNSQTVSTIPVDGDQTFDTYFTVEEVGEHDIEISTGELRETHQVKVKPTVEIDSVSWPSSVEEGESFQVCPQASSQVEPEVKLYRNGVQTDSMTGNGCFTTEIPESGSHQMTVEAVVDGDSDRESAILNVEPVSTTTTSTEKIEHVEEKGPLGKFADSATANAGTLILVTLVAVAAGGYLYRRR